MVKTSMFLASAAAAAALSGPALAQGIANPALNRAPVQAAVPALNANAVTAGLLSDVAALKAEVAALKAQNQAQAQRIAEADKKANDARVAGVGLDKFVTNFKSAYDKHGHFLQFDTKLRLEQIYVVVDGRNYPLHSPYGATLRVVTSDLPGGGAVSFDNPRFTDEPRTPPQ